jgi:hypothetical protein
MIDHLVAAFRQLLDSIISAAPKVAVAIVLIFVGWIVAKVIETVLRQILTRLRFDSLLERAGIDKTLQSIGIRQQLNLLIPRLVYFLVLLLLARTGSDALGLAAISSAIGAFFSYVPNIVAALLLLILGTTVAQFAGDMVKDSALNSGIEFGPALGRIVSSLIIFVVLIMAISQLRIDTEMVRLVTAVLLAGAALAFGISFGLGTRDVVRNLVAGFYARKVLEVGKNLEIAGQQGTLVAITPTHVILEKDDHSVSIANTAFLDQPARQ